MKIDKPLKEWIEEQIELDRLYRFYKTDEWIDLRDKILEENHNECKWCKSEGKIELAETVHHIQHVKSHPELALSRYYMFNGKMMENLVPLCHECHDKAHNRMQYRPKPIPLTKERW